MLLSILIVAFILSTTFAYIGDSLNFLSRVYGALTRRYAVYTHTGMLVQLVNRAAFAIALPILGYFADSQLGLRLLLWIYLLSLGGLALVLLLTALRMSVAFKAIRFARALSHNETDELPSVATRLRATPDRNATLSMLFYLLGFMTPAMLAMTIPDLRGTLLQLGFVLNSFGTLINVLLVEKAFSSHVERANDTTIAEYAQKVVYSRFIATVVVFLAFSTFLALWA